MSREKGMDELMVDYLVNEVIKYSNGGIADESIDIVPELFL